MARRRKRSLAQQYRPEAKLEARLRYGPEKRALGSALSDARGQRKQSVSAAHGVSRGLRSTINATRPEVKGVYRTAGRQLRGSSRLVRGLMPSSPAANAIATAATTEHRAALDRNTEARRASLTDLADQKVQARAGEAFAVRQAGVQYRQDAGKILGQLMGVSQDQGTFAAATLGQLVDAALGRQVTKRGQTLAHRDRVASQRAAARSQRETHRHNVAGEQNAAARVKQQARGKKFAPMATQGAAQDSVHQALDYARDFAKHGATRHQAAEALRRGVPDSSEKREPVMDPATGKQKIDRHGHKVYTVTPGVPGVPAIKSDAYVQAALDVAYDGFLSRGTQHTLRKRGIRVNRLGVPTYHSHHAKRIRQQRTPHPHGGQKRQGAAGYPYGPGAGAVH